MFKAVNNDMIDGTGKVTEFIMEDQDGDGTSSWVDCPSRLIPSDLSYDTSILRTTAQIIRTLDCGPSLGCVDGYRQPSSDFGGLGWVSPN